MILNCSVGRVNDAAVKTALGSTTRSSKLPIKQFAVEGLDLSAPTFRSSRTILSTVVVVATLTPSK